MLRTIDLRGRALTPAELLAAVPRAGVARADALSAAAAIVSDVAERGETALREQAARFDRVEGHALRVPEEHFVEALDRLDPGVRRALEEAIARVRHASRAQVPPAVTTEIARGAVIEQRWRPVARAGVYVPGGKAVYPSSVVMNVVPAQVAGVARIALASPPQAEHGGRVHPDILAAARLLGYSDIRFTSMKGRANYLCRTKLDRFLDDQSMSEPPPDSFGVALLSAFANTSGHGEVDRIPGVLYQIYPELERHRREVTSSDSGECSRQTCHSTRTDCVFRRARERLEGAEIAVVNHDLLLRWPPDYPRPCPAPPWTGSAALVSKP